MSHASAFCLAVLSGGATRSVCDVLVQTTVDRKTFPDEIDWRRTGLFATFGFVFVGAWQYALYSRFLPRVFTSTASFVAKPLREKLKDRRGMREMWCQVGVENLVNQPLLHFPVFYSLKHLIETPSASPIECLENGARTAWQNVVPDNKASLAVWVPAQVVNFGFFPVQLRVPVMAVFGMTWTSWLSWKRGALSVSSDGNDQPLAAAAASLVVRPSIRPE